MSKRHIHRDLYQCNTLIEKAYFNESLSNTTIARKHALEVIKILNNLLKSEPSAELNKIVKELSTFTLELYDSISKGKLFNYKEKLLWLSSKLHNTLFPPIITYSKGLSSFNGQFLPLDRVEEDTKETLELPELLNAHYQEVDLTNWEFSYDDLSNLYQDLLTNCSFVSSFLSIIEGRRVDLLQSLILPHFEIPMYKCKLNFNGCERMVTIDRSLPFLKDVNRNLTINSSTNKDLYWPALIEKAYLNVLGRGYKFDGSNMAIDTYMLINWIPEIIPIANGKLSKSSDEIWVQYLKGNLFVGLGTGKLSTELSKQLNLIPGHDYAITSYDSISRTITLKNPWIEKTNSDKRILHISDSELHFFKYFYVNWNPASLFRFNFTTNFIYSVIEPCETKLYQKPQFTLLNPTENNQTVWLLLEKHLPLKDSDSEQVINISIYQTHSGEKVLVPNQYPLSDKGSITNSRLMLVKFIMNPNQNYTIVVSSSIKSTFTLKLYNNISKDFALSKAKSEYPVSIPMIYDEWGHKNSGGNWSLSTFINNPQYDIEIKESQTNLLIALFSELDDKFVNFHIFQADHKDKGIPMRSFDKSKLIFNEKYNISFQFYDLKSLDVGLYKLIASTYDDNIVGQFKILLHHDSIPDNIEVTKIPLSLGLFLQDKTVEWNNSNRFKLYFETTNFNSRFTFQMQHYNCAGMDTGSITCYRPSIRGSIFNAKTSSPIQINDKWDDSLYGTFIDIEIQEPGSYIILVERFESGTGSCMVKIGCNKKFSII